MGLTRVKINQIKDSAGQNVEANTSTVLSFIDPLIPINASQAEVEIPNTRDVGFIFARGKNPATRNVALFWDESADVMRIALTEEKGDTNGDIGYLSNADLAVGNLTLTGQLHGVSLFSGNYTDLTNKPTLFSGSYTDLTNKPTLFSGSWGDLTNKPSIPAPQVNSDWNASFGTAQILNKPTLSTVATTGSYTDLESKPTTVSTFTNDSGYQTASQVNTAIQAVVGAAPAALDTLVEIAARLQSDESTATALTNTVSLKADKSYVDTQLGTKANSSSLATVATSGSYNDLLGKPTLFSGSYVDLSNKPTLATVATSGSYTDLTNTPSPVVKQVISSAIAAVTATTIKALSNATPVSTDGTQVWTQNITPTNAASKVVIQGSIVASVNTAARHLTLACFRGTTCIGVTMQFFATASKAGAIPFSWVDTPGATSSQTYTIRAFGDATTTWYIGQLSTAYYNGMLASNDITVTEIA